MEFPFAEMQINNHTVRGVVDVNGDLWLLLFDILCAYAICRRVDQTQMAIYDHEPKVHLDQVPIPEHYELPWPEQEYVVRECNLLRALSRFRSYEVDRYRLMYDLYAKRDCVLCHLGLIEEYDPDGWAAYIGVTAFNETKLLLHRNSTNEQPLRPLRLDFWRTQDRRLAIASYLRDFKRFCRYDVAQRDRLRMRRKFVPNFYHQDCESEPSVARHLSVINRREKNLLACYPLDE